MPDYVICLLATSATSVPSRICTLLAQRQVKLVSLQVSRSHEREGWLVQLAVTLDKPAELDLLISRLDRLIDVVAVIDAAPTSADHRQSILVTIWPDAGMHDEISLLIDDFGAEALTRGTDMFRLHLCADPFRCREFTSELARRGTHYILSGPLSGITLIPVTASLKSPTSLTR